MTESRSPEFQQLLAAVGELMFSWYGLEEALIEDIERLRTALEGRSRLVRPRDSFGDWLREWRALLSQKSRRHPGLEQAGTALANEMEQLRQKRTAVIHEFAGAFDGADDGEPFIRCGPRDRDASDKRITLSELRALIDSIGRCRQRVGTLGTDAMAPT